MAKNKLLKMTSAILSVAVLANTCIAGMFSTSAAEEPIAGGESTSTYIDNSSLIPVCKADENVTLELSDDGVNYWTPD